MFSYTCGLKYVNVTNLHVIHIWSGKFSLIEGELLGRETDMQSSEPTQTSQRQDAFRSNIFICDSGLHSFSVRPRQHFVTNLYIHWPVCAEKWIYGGPHLPKEEAAHLPALFHPACSLKELQRENPKQESDTLKIGATLLKHWRQRKFRWFSHMQFQVHQISATEDWSSSVLGFLIQW